MYMSSPCQTEPCLPGIVFGLETTAKNYVLTINSNWIWANNVLIFENLEYIVEDNVEIIGITTIKEDINSEEYTELEINSIQKLTSKIELIPFDGKIYYDGVTQTIVFDETLQNQSLTFELMDIQGRMLIRKTGISNSISIADLPRGLYLYRIMQNNHCSVVYKILKTN
ncbi:T9SS type A sorting domain-containing protein [Bacteroidales bacterium OttesenSCG-928-L19]|nr:T9SS type A sorting domain-containing protein [Bacteroidales bacterium OttesenSCG-928-L19]